jgi:transposase
VKPHAGKEIHVVLDNLPTHDAPEVRAWLARNPNVTFHFIPVGSSWINQIETRTWNSRQEKRRIRSRSVTAPIRVIDARRGGGNRRRSARCYAWA